MNLATIFHPISTADFLVDYFGKQRLHASGAVDRFAGLHAVDIANDLERELEAPIRAEENSVPDELHRGTHDVIVLQRDGESKWTTYGPEAASAEQDWSASLEPGAALYVPRAFWRTAQSSDANARSWIFQIQNPTGADLLDWIVSKVRGEVVFQSEIPRFASPAEQADYLARLRKTVASAFRAPGMLPHYLRRLHRLQPVRPARRSDRDIDFLMSRKPAIFRTDPETVHIFVAGKEVYFHEEAVPLLQYLIDHAPVTAAAFYSQFEGEFDHDELASFLEALSRASAI